MKFKNLPVILVLLMTHGIISGQPPGLTLSHLRMAEQNVVLLNNEGGDLPLQRLEKIRIAVVHFDSNSPGNPDTKVFDSIANKYSTVESFKAYTNNGNAMLSDSMFNLLHDQLRLFDRLIITFSGSSFPDVANDKLPRFINGLGINRKLILVYRGEGKNLAHFDSFEFPIVWSADATPESASVTAQLIFGGVATNNKLATGFSKKFRKGKGFRVIKSRLGYGIPASVSIDQRFLNSIDSLVEAGIAAHVTPGAVVLLVKDGIVIHDKAYGKHTYADTILTRADDIYDMASVTKVTATTPVIMQLYEKKMLYLDTPISHYVRALQNINDKKEQTIREALLHEAGFTPYIKFFEKLTPLDLSYQRSADFPVQLADNFFLRKNYFEKVMWPVTLQSPVLTRGKFIYSDVSMYMMKEVAENIMHRSLDEYVLDEIYLPLGMKSSGFLPRGRFDKSRIVPTTENDNWLRNMRVVGFVNDPGAAMAGGVEGHAGLFSTSNDLAIYYQMLLNKGSYGERKYFEPSTVELFTSRQSKVTNRGLGFAKTPEPVSSDSAYPSQLSFGHSGYTGTYVWVDPKYNLVYIFLSNRVYPDDGRTYGPAKINVRSEALNLFYKAAVFRK
ncbi:MAG: beta-N-acetylglucosaminidase [Chitinophagaceae bacterium]|nr:MAG: beta-N-acetylglucosaminidase [Chitinophagaceae bacterium]